MLNLLMCSAGLQTKPLKKLRLPALTKFACPRQLILPPL